MNINEHFRQSSVHPAEPPYNFYVRGPRTTMDPHFRDQRRGSLSYLSCKYIFNRLLYFMFSWYKLYNRGLISAKNVLDQIEKIVWL